MTECKYVKFLELVVIFDRFVKGTDNEKLIKRAKDLVVTAYFNSAEDSDHCKKINRVQDMLTKSIRRTDEIISKLLQERAITQLEYESLTFKTFIYERVENLLSMLCRKDDSAYQCFLHALDGTNQQHLRRTLEEIGQSCFLFL